MVFVLYLEIMAVNKKKIILLVIVLFFISIYFIVVLKGLNKNAGNEQAVKETGFVPAENFYKYSFKAANIISQKIKTEFSIEKIDKENKEDFDIRLRNKLNELLNFPLSRIPESAISLETLQIFPLTELGDEPVDKGKYIEKKIYFYTSNISFADAYLLIPKNVEFPAPAIIAMHQHGDTKYGIEEIVGHIGDETMFYAKELAEQGYIVLAMNSDSFGDRRIDVIDSDDIIEKIDAQDLFIMGLNPLGVVVQEDLVSFGLLLSIDIVDKNNIGCIGHSFGGIRCMYLAALDKRVKAVVLSNSIADTRKNPQSGISHTWLGILPGIGKYAETKEILGLIAPRPLITFNGEKDPILPALQTKEQLAELEKLYQRLGKESNLVTELMKNKSHEFPIEFRKMAYKFLDEHLKNQKK
ncbi:hypothetical protein HYX16_03955 [Candidatus Woesearchaeota archaeon]|nr:hypothetical protein [Candidatus Woesearchaeota archaeon]